MSRKTGEIISIFEKAYKETGAYIPLSYSDETKMFDAQEMKTITENSDIFFMASKSRIVLVHWICEFVRKLFEKYDYSDIDIMNESYDAIRERFKSKAFNRLELAKMFGVEGAQKLSYENFVDMEQKYIDAYNAAVDTGKLSSMTHISIREKEENRDLVQSLNNILNTKRFKDILMKRATGCTLDQVGKTFMVTRERIRQIETKPRIQIERWMDTNAEALLKSVCRNNALDDKRVARIFGEDNLKILKYIISTKMFATKWSYLKEIDMVVYDETDNFSEDLEVVLTGAKEEKVYFDEALESLLDGGYLFLNEERFKKILLAKNYNVYRNEIYFGKMTIGKAISLSALSYPGNRVKITDKESLQKFADYINENYQMNVKIGRALSTRIQDILIMVDKATYGPKSLIDIPDDVFDSIKDYVRNMEGDRISYKSLFNRFRDVLTEKSSINNQYFLHGLMREFEDESDYICLRYYVCKESVDGTRSRDYFRQLADLLIKNGPMSTEEIVKAIPDWNEMYIKYAMMYYPEIVQWDKNVFANINAVSFTAEELKNINRIVEKCLDNKFKYTSSYVLYDQAVEEIPEILDEHGISNEKQFFAVIQRYYGEQYTMKKPHMLGGKKLDSFTTDDFIRLLASRTRIVDKRDLIKDMIKYYGSKNSSLSLSLQKVLADYYRVGRYEYMQKKKLKLTDEDIEKIREQLDRFMICGTVLLFDRITSYKDFPDIGVAWNKWILSEIIQDYDLGLKKIAQPSNASIHSLLPVVSKDTGDTLQTKEAIIKWLIKNEYKGKMEYADLMRYIRSLDIYHTAYSAEEIYDKFKDAKK